MSLAAVRARLANAAILLDFDGTLAPIVADPAAARPLPEAAPIIADLCRRASVVAVISGRPEAFIRSVLDVSRLEVVGLYGLAGAPPLAEPVVTAVTDLATAEPGVEVEDKGVSLAVHVRRAGDPEAVSARLRPELQALAEANELTVFDGKQVIELAPPGARKGAVVHRLLRRVTPEVALYAGDDLEDLEAFDALAGAGIPMCRVAVVTSETPAHLVEVADVHVDGPAALLELLAGL